MTLGDLRKLSVKQQLRIRFVLPNGMECVLTEHGIAQIPALKSVPDFNLEQQLENVAQFQIEQARPADPKKAPKPQTVTRARLAEMTAAGGPETPHHDHDDE